MTESNSVLADEADDTASGRQPGLLLCGKLAHLLESARMFSVDHNRCRQAASDLVDLLEERLREAGQSSMVLVFDDGSVLLDDHPIAMDDRQHKRIEPFCDRLEHHGFNTIRLDEELTVDAILEFVEHLTADEPVPGSISFDGLSALRSDTETRSRSRDVVQDEEQMVLRLYSAFVMRCRNYYAALDEERQPRTANLKRNVQRIVDRLDERHLVFAGLASMNLVGQFDFAHGADRAIYAMVLADAVGLDSTSVARCGLAAVTPNPVTLGDDAEQPPEFGIGGDDHFRRNLSAVAELTRTGSRDVLSALRAVAAYERGFPLDRELPSRWYDDHSRPHLLTRLLAVVRDYDLLVRGFEDVEAVGPDIAFQILMEHAKSRYDTVLVKLFVTTLGLYPVGSVVELSDGRRAFVVQPPEIDDSESPFRAMRPRIRPLDCPGDLIDLADEDLADLTIERVVDSEKLAPDDRPDARWLF